MSSGVAQRRVYDETGARLARPCMHDVCYVIGVAWGHGDDSTVRSHRVPRHGHYTKWAPPEGSEAGVYLRGLHALVDSPLDNAIWRHWRAADVDAAIAHMSAGGAGDSKSMQAVNLVVAR